MWPRLERKIRIIDGSFVRRAKRRNRWLFIKVELLVETERPKRSVRIRLEKFNPSLYLSNVSGFSWSSTGIHVLMKWTTDSDD